MIHKNRNARSCGDIMVPMRHYAVRQTIVLAVLGLTLGGCAAGSKLLGIDLGGADQTATPAPAMEAAAAPPATPIDVAALDPLNQPPPPQNAAAADPLLVPAPGAGARQAASQRVPLGSLGASPPGPPVALTAPPAAQAAPKMPALASTPAPAPAPTPAATPASAPAAVPPPAVAVAAQAPMLKEPVAPRTAPLPPAFAPPVIEMPPRPDSGIAPTGPPETVVISSASVRPALAREFLPASVIGAGGLTRPAGPGEISLTAGEKNVVRRFEALRRLREGDLITQEEYGRRRAANIGALLPYTHQPPGFGMDRAVPNAEVVVARLAALRRSFEMRAITAQQHALERTMILNALLPEIPDERMERRPPPADLLAAAAMVGHLEVLRMESLISAPEFEAEKAAIEQVMSTGFLPSEAPASKSGAAKGGTKVASNSPAMPAAAAASALDTPITGPVLHLASFRSEASAMNGWNTALAANRGVLGGVKPIVRKVDLGAEKGIFYRLMTGPFASLSAAEAACIQLKQNNQFCRASADGS